MSEESVKITSVEKTKDPRNVEAGKKLAAVSQQAKERKAQHAQQRELGMQRAVGSDDSNVPISGFMIAFAGGLIVGAVVLHYRSKEEASEGSKQSTQSTATEGTEGSVQSVDETPKQMKRAPRRKLDSLD